MSEVEVLKCIEDIFIDPITISNAVMVLVDDVFENKKDIKLDADGVIEPFCEAVLFQAAYTHENIVNNDVAGEVLAAWLKKKKSLNIIQWEPSKERYPKFMLLGTDKGILAYVETFYHSSCVDADIEMIVKYGICHKMRDLKERLVLIDSDLDRPVFYVHILNYPRVKGVFFETTEMIKNNIYEESKCIDIKSAREYYFSDLSEMGDFEELIKIFDDLKKNNVKLN